MVVYAYACTFLPLVVFVVPLFSNLFLITSATRWVTMTSMSFIEVPVSLNATLGATVTFRCSLHSGPIFWTLNGADVTHGIFTTSQPGSRLSILSLIASEANNNSLIHCITFMNGVETLTYPAELKVQGDLAAPDLSVISITNEVIKLKWVPPFTLDITNVDPDITNYSLHIWSLDTGEHVVIVTNDSEYTFTKDNNICRIYKFTVAGVNTVGKGNRSSPVIVDFPAVELVNGPSDTVVVSGQWASFMCTVRCPHLIGWYIEGSSIHQLFPRLQFHVLNISSCGVLNSGQYTQSLEILVNDHLNNTHVQCAVLACINYHENGCANTTAMYTCFSNSAALMVESHVSESSPYPCPSSVHSLLRTRAHSSFTITNEHSPFMTSTSKVSNEVDLPVIIGGAAAGAGIVFIVVIVGSLIYVRYYCQHHKTNEQRSENHLRANNENPETKRNMCYETHVPKKVLKRNPAYECTTFT